MNKAKLKLLVIGTALAAVVGCATPHPVYNVTSAPIFTNKKDPSLADISKTIIRAGAGLGWQMTADKPGHILGKLALRTHIAIVDIDYDVKTYSIKYKDSTNLDYNGTMIHKNYNGWIQNLDNRIRAELTAL